MGPVYATRLTILPDDNHSSNALHDKTLEVCHRWIAYLCNRYGMPLPEDRNTDLNLYNPQVGSSVTTNHLRLDSDQAWRAVIIHPYQPNGLSGNHIQMRAEIQARDEQGEEVVTVRILVGSTVDRIRPLAYRFKTPGVVKAILSEFQEVFIGNVTAGIAARYLHEDEIPRLATEITRASRFAPFIVISRTQDNQLLCDPDAIANEIAGLGRVYVLPSYESGFELTHCLNKELSCFDGAVRLYWPELTIGDNPYDHPLWLGQRIQTENLSSRLPGRIFGMLASASMIGISSDIKTWNIYRSSSEAKTESVIQNARRIAESKIASTEEDFFDAVQQLEDLQQEHNLLRDRIYQLEASNEALTHTIRESRDQDDPAVFTRKALRCKTVLEAVELFNEIIDDEYLTILPDAFESAERAPYQGAISSVFDMLMTIRAVARRYHEQGDALGHKAMFEDEGETNYSATISNTAKYGSRRDYEHTYKSNGITTKVICDQHIANGGGAPKSTVVIYWHVDTDKKKFVIGHIGRHLRGKQDT